MTYQSGRYSAAVPASVAAGWTLERLTPPSRLFGANGLRTGKDGRIYVAQVPGSQVSAIDPDSGAIETITGMGGGIIGPDDLAFDDDGNLYLTEITEGRVSMLAPNGTTRVIAGHMPVANPITYHQGRLIAGELRMGGRIIELDRNGGAHRVIYDKVPMANAFEVGPDGMLYFPAQAANEIWRISLDGGEPEVVAKDLGIPDSVKFHPDGYIVSTQVHSGQVLKIDPRTGASEVLADIGPGLDNVTFVGKRTFVSHITGSVHEVLAGGKVRPLVEKGLQWPMGLAVNGAGALYVADGMFAYILGRSAAPEMVGMLFSPNYPGFMRGVAASGVNEWVITNANGAVMRWRPAEQASEELASGYDQLMGVAIGEAGEIVFAESVGGRVLVLQGGHVSELARGLDRPTGVALGDDGSVYVSEAGGGRVSKLAGGTVQMVLDGLGEPQGIAIHRGKLLVIDTRTKLLSELDLASGARIDIASDLPVGVPPGVIAAPLRGVGDMCGPMTSFTGLAVRGDGTIFVSADTEGSVIAIRPSLD